MNQLTGQKNVVLDRLQQLINAFTQDGPLIEQIMNARLHPATETQRQAMRAQIVSQLQAYATEAGTPQAEPWYAPQNSTIALVQAAMEQQLGPDIQDSQRRSMVDSTGAPIPERFGDTDPAWIEVVIDLIATGFEGKATFVTHADVKDFMV